jgi:hypothetical protein
MLTGSGNGASVPDSTMATPAGGDTTTAGGGGQPQGDGGGQPQGGGQQRRDTATPGNGGAPVDTGTTPIVPPVDSAAIVSELGQLLDALPLEGPADPADLRRLDELMNDGRLPANLRADAAAQAALAYYNGGDDQSACDRIRRSLLLDPANPGRRQQMASIWGCNL